MRERLTLPAPAKLNLFLHILGRRADGYHELQTLFQFLDHADELHFAPREDGQIRLHTEIPGVPQVRLLTARFADLMPETRLDATLTRTAYTGLENAEMFVAHIDPGTPADLAGLRVGDLITTIDGQPVKHWAVLTIGTGLGNASYTNRGPLVQS